MNPYVFTYHGSEVRAIHRSMSETVSLTEALAFVDFVVLDYLGMLTVSLNCKIIV